MNIVVFSYNRALQLHAFLTSFYRHFFALDFELNVIYNSGGGDYEKGYQQLIAEFPNARFIRRKKIESLPKKYFFTYRKNLYRYFKHPNLRNNLTNFKQLVEQVVSESAFETVAFFTDDSIFYRDIQMDGNILRKIAADKNAAQVYSLRHGRNIAPQPKSLVRMDLRNYSWDVVPAPGELAHWTHLFSIDGHVYPRQLLLPILKKLNYVNPNSLEGFVNDYVTTECPRACKKLIFPEESVLLGFELNKVQTFANNNNLNFSVEYLNRKFMEGYRLSYLYDDNNVNDFRPQLEGIEFVHEETGSSELFHFQPKVNLTAI